MFKWFAILCLTLLTTVPTITQDDDAPFLPELEVITTDNVNQIEQVGMLGYGLIEDAAYSPDGETTAIAGSLGLLFYDADAFENAPFQRWMLPEAMVFAVAHHPNGEMIATVSGERDPLSNANCVFRLWQVETQTVLAEWTAPHHREKILFSPDGHTLVVVNKRYQEDAQRWDISDLDHIVILDGLPIAEIERQWAGVISTNTHLKQATYSPDGQYMAYTSYDCNSDCASVNLIETASDKVLFMLQPDEYMGSGSLYFSPNSQLLVSLAYSEAGMGVIEAWNVKNGEKVLYAPTGGVRALGFHPTESALVFGTWYEAGIRQWKIGMVEPKSILGQANTWEDDHFTEITFNTDGSVLAAIHAGAVEFWDIDRGVKAHDDLHIQHDDWSSPRDNYTQIAYSPDGRYFAAASNDMFQLYDAATMHILSQVSYDGNILDLCHIGSVCWNNSSRVKALN